MSVSASATLLENVSSSVTGQWKDYPGGHTVFTVVGTLTGTAVIQVLAADGSAVPVTALGPNSRNANTTAALAPGKYRADLSGATGVSNVWVTIERVPY
jgi:hypothetical protein